MSIFMKILRINLDYKLFLEIIFYLQRVPDADKRYIKDSERKNLLEQATDYCIHSFKEQLKKHAIEKRSDNEMLTLIIEIFKAHKKMKNPSQKESPFSCILTDTYKAYGEGKVWIQENVNYLDSANKFCTNLTNQLKNQEKQQQTAGPKQTLEELGLKILPSSLLKACATIPPVQPIVSATQPVVSSVIQPTPINVVKPPVVTKAVTSGVTSITTTTSITTAPTAKTTTVPSVTSRPRGRPPGSKNQNSKDPAKAAALQQKIMAPMMQHQPSALPNLELATAHLEPSIKARILTLLTDITFMTTVASFTQPTARTTLLRKYFTLSNFQNIPQLIEGFIGVLNYLDQYQLQSMMQPPTSMANMMQSQTKQPEMDKPITMPSSSAMSIFPTTNKPHPSLTTSPSKSFASSSIPASITPVPSSASLLKPGASTVISVGSIQLTITPSISIIPNPTKPTPVLPQMPAPSFNIQKASQPKVRRSAGDKPTKPKMTKAQRFSQGMIPDLTAIDNLPKSLSIIAAPNQFMPGKQLDSSIFNTAFMANKPAKQTKPKKKSLDANKVADAIKLPEMDPSLLNKQITNQQLQSILSHMGSQGPSFLSHYEQFLTGVQPPTVGLTRPFKSKASTVTTSQQQKLQGKQPGGIKVKGLDQLQGKRTPKANEKATPKAKQTFQTPPNIGNVKNPPIARSPTVLNAYGTTISSVAHANQPMPSSFTNNPIATNMPANVQISPTKTLQQKLAERQRQFMTTPIDLNTPSRPSSTSPAGSSKTRKSETEVIVLD